MTATDRKNDAHLVTALACGATVEAAAKAAEVSEATVYRRLRSRLPEAGRRRESRDDRACRGPPVGHVDGGRRHAPQAADGPIRERQAGAARSILELGSRLREAEDLVTRIKALKNDSRKESQHGGTERLEPTPGRPGAARRGGPARPLRILASECGVPYERLLARYEERRAETARLPAEGHSEREILALVAARLGVLPDELRRRADELTSGSDAGNLGRRLTALEEIAEQVRRREVRNLVASLPDAHDLTPAELEEATDEAIRALDDFAERRRQGVSEREILRRHAERIAAELGVDAAEVLAEAGADPEVWR